MAEAYPALAEFLELEEVRGEPRTAGSLLIFTHDGRLKAMIKDPDSSAVCFVSGMSLDEVLVAVDKVLATGDGDWREDRSPHGRGKRS